MFAMLITRIGIPIENIFKKYCHEQLGTTSYPMRVISTQLQMANFVMETEIWKDISGYEGLYQVSNFGRVKRLFHSKKSSNRFKSNYDRSFKEVVLNPPINNGKYRRVGLTSWSKLQKNYFVHRLVATTFIGQIPEGYTVNHKDGNKLNNKLSNLEIIHHQLNMQHASSCIKGNELYIIKRKPYGTYRVRINKDKKSLFNKSFKTIEEAIIARDEQIKKHGIKIYEANSN